MPSLRSGILFTLALTTLTTAFSNLEEPADASTPQAVSCACGMQIAHVNSPGSSWSVSNAFYQRHIEYAAYQSIQVLGGVSNAQQECIELCYHYGDVCVSSLWAENIPSDAFGMMQNGSTACYLFNKTIGQGDLQVQPRPSFANVVGSNLWCDEGCPR